MPPTAVVFDFNGTISHDEPLLAVLFREMFAEIGIDVTESLYFEEFAGYSDPEIVNRVLARFGRGGEPETAKRLVARRIELYLAAVAERSPVQPGAAAAVREIAARVPVAIASGASRPEIEAVLKATGLRPLFEVIVTAEDISNSKPHPEGYLIALEQLGVPGRRSAGVRGLGSGRHRGDLGGHAVRGRSRAPRRPTGCARRAPRT